MVAGRHPAAKRPHFDHNSRFDFLCFGRRSDFILAQSIISHTGPDQLAAFFRDALRRSSLMARLLSRSSSAKDCDEPGWHYPECVTYRNGTIAAVAAAQGLSVSPTDWPAMNRQEGSVISRQMPVVVSVQG